MKEHNRKDPPGSCATSVDSSTDSSTTEEERQTKRIYRKKVTRIPKGVNIGEAQRPRSLISSSSSKSYQRKSSSYGSKLFESFISTNKGFDRSESLKLDFQNIHVQVAKTDCVNGKEHCRKTILRDVSCSVKPGDVLALMGPSGAGKTTLMKALTLDATYGKVSGSVTLCGCAMSHRMFKRFGFVVEQHDRNWSHLTSRETLRYVAQLYDVVHTAEEAEALVEDILERMGLLACADTTYCKDLSGGQQRRLSLAIALVKQPKVLFLDEPTSGLDAAAARSIMEEITSVAKSEQLIILCTIHQPSSKVYGKFDQVMLLSKGRQAFVGKRKEAVVYFRDELKDPVPKLMNPAEHFLDVFNADFSSNEEVDAKLDAWEKYSDSHKRPSLIAKDDSSSTVINESDLLGDDTPHSKFAISQVKVLMRRQALLIVRDPILYVGRCMVFLVVNMFFGIAYLKSREYTQDQAISKMWVLNWYVGVPANLGVVAVYFLNEELNAIFREHKNGMVSVPSYIFCKSILSLPFYFAFAFFALALPAFIISDFPWSAFPQIMLLWTACIFVFESMAESMAVLFLGNPILGMLSFISIWFLALLFSGVLVPPDDLYWPLNTFMHALPMSYWARSSIYIAFSQAEWEPCVDPTSSAVCVNSADGIDVLEAFSRIFPLISAEDNYVIDLMTLIGIGLCWKLVAIVTTIVKSNRASRIEPEDSLGVTNTSSTSSTRSQESFAEP